MPVGTAPSISLTGITNLAVVATVKQGFVEGFETISHLYRLQQILRTLNAIRQGAREPAQLPSPFIDPVGRFDIAHVFRFTVLPPDNQNSRARLLLNVTFDGGWEPYMRVIWRDLGTLLDLMFCHCEDYPLSHTASCETYLRWVREHEVPAGFFYIDSAMTVVDQRLLREWQSRSASVAGVANGTGAANAAPAAPALPDSIKDSLKFKSALRVVRAFSSLRPYFPANALDDEGILRRGAHNILPELTRADGTGTLGALLPPNDPLRQVYGAMIAWFDQRVDTQPLAVTQAHTAATATANAPLPLTDIQGGILRNYANVTHGALVLLRVENAAQAQEALARWPVTTEAQHNTPPQVRLNVALTCSGLLALGLPRQALDRLPQEFIDGMESRAGILGDMFHNHPDHWQPPWHLGDTGRATRLALSSVHVVVQVRALFPTTGPHAHHGTQASWDGVVHPGLQSYLERLITPDCGLKTLAVEAMHRHNVGQVSQEHFGFQDGFSQPVVAAAAAGCPVSAGQQWDDHVPAGDLLLGYPNSRGDVRVPDAADSLLDNGTFLVVRKLAQQVERLQDWAEQAVAQLRQRHGAQAPDAQTLLALMMGRRQTGQPLVPTATVTQTGNDFNYHEDPRGALCPLQSHVRRANPRDQSALKPPRIARRGMSYGPRHQAASGAPQERGLFFMAYNASIAEQFEVIQRWISGGNSTHLLSWQNDPFLGTVAPGTRRQFQFQHQGVDMQVDLGVQPFVELRWGLYLLVPSVTALRSLKRWVSASSPAPATPVTLPVPASPPALADKLPLDHDHWKYRLEDLTLREAAWAQVRRQPGGVLRTDYGVLVGSKTAVMEVFNDPQQRYSVHGYGERMRASVGLGYLGQDGDSGHDRYAHPVNAVVESVREDQAFDLTQRIVTQMLRGALQAASPAEAEQGLPIDLMELSERVLALLCTEWFGLPDRPGRYVQVGSWTADKHSVPTCPGHFISASKFIFSPRPSATVQQYGKEHGRLLRDSVADFLRDPAAQPGPLTQQIVKALRQADAGVAEDLIARTVTGIILGFAPTVYGNLRSIFSRWVTERTLWDLQVMLHDRSAPEGSPYVRANARLRKPLIEAIMRRPAPDMVWRTARSDHTLSGVNIREGDRLIVGILSATQADVALGQMDVFTAFGGARPALSAAGAPSPMHACPGYSMGMGVMLGLTSALLDAGTLCATSSPTTVLLKP